eukprot:TRINITY_DN4248_c0_g1_i1.p1 TRINITY_DN4248_c0_g1~~TRINITY_DN4248_c0_g1_i1.p1  ORF type:complete len:691 (-),score=175.94 TRINITY_DN4248_c0_g1_i1:2106-4178(-)
MDHKDDELLWEVPSEFLAGSDAVWVWDPVDLHHHFRDGAAMHSVVRDAAKQFGAVLAMPNLVPPVATVSEALAYRQSILDAIEAQHLPKMTPLMTLYLTDNTDPQDLLTNNTKQSPSEGAIVACKLYPAGATTNSHNGVTDVRKIYPVLQVMEKLDILLLIHAEVTDPKVDIFAREEAFISTVVAQVVQDFPNLKVVLEHATTEYAVEFVKRASDKVAASITAHHLLLNRNALFEGGFRPHHYCLPVLKSERDRLALVGAVVSGNPKFFLGTDSAPHTRNAKECCKGKAGCYTAHNALEFYAETFDAAGALSRLPAFASVFGPRFYGFKANPSYSQARYVRILTRSGAPRTVPEEIQFGDSVVVPLRSGEKVSFDLFGKSFQMDSHMLQALEKRKNALKWSDAPVDVSRKNWNELVIRQSSLSKLPEAFKVENLTATSKLGVSTPVRYYLGTPDASPRSIIVYFHSGALLFGNIDTHDVLARTLSLNSEHPLISVDYRLCPENSFQDCLDDAHNVVEWLTSSFSPSAKLILAADSSGAQLALSANRYLRHSGRGEVVVQTILWYPSIGISEPPLVWDPSYAADRQWIKEQVFAKAAPSGSNLLEELKLLYEPIKAPDSDFNGLAPTLVVACAFDPGCPYQVEFGRKLARAGVSTRLWIFGGLHGALFQYSAIPSSAQLVERSAEFLSKIN